MRRWGGFLVAFLVLSQIAWPITARAEDRSPIDVEGSIDARYGEGSSGGDGARWQVGNGLLELWGHGLVMRYDDGSCVTVVDALAHMYSFLPDDAVFLGRQVTALPGRFDEPGIPESTTELWSSVSYGAWIGQATTETGFFTLQFTFRKDEAGACGAAGTLDDGYVDVWALQPLHEPLQAGDVVMCRFGVSVLRAEAGASSAVVIDDLEDRSCGKMEVVQGPVHLDGTAWYEVRLLDGAVGWIDARDIALGFYEH